MFHRRWKSCDAVRRGVCVANGNTVGRLDEVIDADLRSCNTAHYGNAKLLLKTRGVDRDTVTPRLIDQIEIDDNAVRNVENLENKVQIAFEPGSVDNRDRDVGPTEQDEITGDLFIAATSLQGVSPR